MASYKSDVGPPSRPRESSRGKRLGTYMQMAPSSMERRELDTQVLGQMAARRGHPSSSRTQQAVLPQRSLREPTSSSTVYPETKSNPAANASTTFGFSKTSSKPTSRPELKNKSSRNVLRRKPSSVVQQPAATSRPATERTVSSGPPKQSRGGPAERRPTIGTSSKSTDAYNEIFTRRARTPAAKEPPPVIPELDRYRARPEQATLSKIRSNGEVPKLATQDLPPPTPLLSGTPGYSGISSSHSHRYSGYSGSGYSASPSTRFSESPGPGAAYSRDTTPTSMSSQSPGLIAPMKMNLPRLRQVSPVINRPPLTRRREGSFPENVEKPTAESQGLGSVQESVTSLSSNSTVKGGAKNSEKGKKRNVLTAPPSSPPPRKSSQKFKNSSSDALNTPSKAAQSPARSIMSSPSDVSSLKARADPIQSPLKHIPPVRPSREGAPDLQSQLGDSMTVIQSNLAGLPVQQPSDRRQSLLQRRAITSPLQTQSVVRPSQGSKLPSRNPSPSPVVPSDREATPAPTGLGIIPDLRPRDQGRGITTRTPSPSVSTSKTRFGLFGRRTKTAPEVPTIDTKEKNVRKGPAAGTGHEGYGRYALRGRSTSTGAGTLSRDRSRSRTGSSRDSTGSTYVQDPFLLERMSPVIISGGGEIKENRNASTDQLSRTESSTSLIPSRPSLDSRGSSRSNLTQEVPRATLWPSAMPKEPVRPPVKLPLPKGRRPSDSSDDGPAAHSLAFRRSMLRLNNSDASLNLPQPLRIPSRGVSPAMSSIDASIMSDDSTLGLKPIVSRGRKEETKKPKKLEKRARSPTKWNIFHRSQPTTKPKSGAPLQVAVGKPAPRKAAVPHYAMLDSSDEQQEIDPADLTEILREADVVDLSNEELDALQFSNYKENLRRIENLHIATATLAPAEKPQEKPVAPPVSLSPEPIEVTPQTELHLSKDTVPTRPSRLPQVGRIPKVISARPQATSPKSFSRPFARLSTVHPFMQLSTIDKQSLAVGPSPQPSTRELQANDLRQVSTAESELSRESSGDSKLGAEGANHRDFLHFSPARKGSEVSSSSGGLSFVGAAGTTAVIPEVGAELEEDEIWYEFDDLIQHGDDQRPLSTTSSCGVPFQYEGYESRRMRKSRMKSKASPTVPTHPIIQEPTTEQSTSRRSVFTTSSVYSQDVGARLLEVQQSPTSAISFGDFISGYGDRNNSIHSESAQPADRDSRCSMVSSSTIFSDGDVSPISQVNLRVGSMTVSKWLTFGHVLFSPARDEIASLEGSSKRHSILVIDGLGNDDWSFYAAETYPNSTFYNLSPTRPLSTSERSNTPSLPLSPPNHRQIQYTSPDQKFPFPSSNFNVVVLRFPTAMAESSYRNLVAESKRVLKPGGYLETAILDLDMLNMGNRARRAVRGLKVKMQVADPSTSLSPASDMMLRLLGKRGFNDVKTCNVGIPVASVVGKKGEAKKEERSLADMMRDESEGGDEGITKMVAKVGRWWYTRCYETGILPDGDVNHSIFNDNQLLSECETWNSSFKLVVAYAQKPVVSRRRTASV